MADGTYGKRFRKVKKMQKLVKEYLDERNRRHRKSRRVGIAVLLLAVIVAGSVMSILSAV